ncbi:zf-TFIIB domain-containing protein [Candidatus Sumerlaeota bacterium]|nr:zf-TFIIB domain-containing protein [Candidatus Sumerlaeota bacterium]
MKCKDCHVEMVCRPRLDVTYHECPKCGGLWFNEGELDSLIRGKIAVDLGSAARSSFEPVASSSMVCPTCGDGVRLVEMTTYATSKVKIMGCSVCFGRWLSRDQGRELVRLVCYSGFGGFFRKIGDRLSGDRVKSHPGSPPR